MPHCCVPKCSNDFDCKEKFIFLQENNKRISFHTFPKDENKRKQWIIKIRRDIGPNFKITQSTVVCSAHFKDDDYKRTCIGLTTNNLKAFAVPSVFQWSQDDVHLRRPPLKREFKTKTNRPLHVLTKTESVNVPPPLPEHDYDVRNNLTPEEEIKNLKKCLAEMEAKLTTKSIEKFGLERFSKNDQLIRFYTGFVSYKILKQFFHSIAPHICTMVSWSQIQRQSSKNSNIRVNSDLCLDTFGSRLHPIDQLFMFLHKLKVGSMDLDLADKFCVSQSTVSRNTITWANFLYFVLGSQPLRPTKEQVITCMPSCFKNNFPSTRVIIDCTEISVQTPSSMVLNSQFYSNYKGRTTLKCLIGITPGGAICFVSSLYAGSISDKELTRVSGILDLLEEGDEIMADKGFLIADLLEEKKCKLTMPHFLVNKKQFSKQQTSDNKVISNMRVHVERAIRRCKEYHLFDSDVPLVLLGTVNQLWSVACLLTNFHRPLIILD